MTIGEKLYFVRHLRDSFSSIGAIIPTSRYAARAMAAECARLQGPKRILEVGAGTGSITAEIIKYLGPDDHLVVCEINTDFVAYLCRRFERDPAFRQVRDRVTLLARSVTELEGSEAFDCIVSAVPFTSCPPDVTEAILERYRELLKPGGVLTYIEYAYLRTFKRLVANTSGAAVDAVVDRYIEAYQFRRDMAWRNVPPAWVRQLRFAEPLPQDALRLAPLEQARRVGVGRVGFAADALLSVAALGALGVLLRRWGRGFWALPLLLAGVIMWFFRDPVRRVVRDPAAVYAACDGRVLAVERVRDERFGADEWLRIAVFLSLLDVHINRAPVAGKVAEVIHAHGGYAAADHADAEHNVALYMVIDGVHGRCVVAQRSGMIARRIVSWGSVGTLMAQGERYGLIRFGSRTDVYLPAALVEACVLPGDRVRGGETLIARYVAASAK